MQLFLEFDESIKVPTIEKLLKNMFKEQQISFSEVEMFNLLHTLFTFYLVCLQVPSKLLVQVPRYGKQFQTYKRIIPGIKFDTTPLLDTAGKLRFTRVRYYTVKHCFPREMFLLQ